MKKIEEYILPDIFWRQPLTATTTVTTKQFQDVLLKNDGKILACGYFWNIKGTKIGPGVYRIYLEKD